MALDFHTLDVFTDRTFSGNPLAVVLDADGLDGGHMQTIAREFNLSETVFVLEPDNPSHSAKIRIFTPEMEVPFAGHPTIGTAALLAEQRSQGPGVGQDALVILEEQIGPIRVGVRANKSGATFAEFDAPALPVHTGTLAPDDTIAAALQLIPSEIGFANHRPIRFSAGNGYAFIPVASGDALAKAGPDLRHWDKAFGNQDLIGAYLYTRDTAHTRSAFQTRMFAPEFGIPEDPATGSAAVAFAGVIHAFDAPPDGMHRRTLEQGYQMNRESEITLTLGIEARKLSLVRIGGSVVKVSCGQLAV